MANPGDQVPAGDDYVVRRLDDLQRQINELGPSVAKSFDSTVASLLTATTAHSEIDGFSLSTTPVELARVTISVPAGYTRALVMGAAGVSGANPSSSLAFPLKAYCDINGATSTTPLSATLGFISQAAVFPSASAILIGLSGGSTFYVRVMAYTGASSIPANSVNRATVDAAVTFLK